MAVVDDLVLHHVLPTRPAESSSSSSPKSSGIPQPEDNVRAHRKAPNRSRGKRLGPNFTHLTNRFRLNAGARNTPQMHHTPREVLPAPLPVVGAEGGLDPFLQLPTALSARDRGLVQFCGLAASGLHKVSANVLLDITTLPRIWYGASSEPVFSFLRDISLQIAIQNEPFLYWTCLCASEEMVRSTTTSETEARLAARWVSGYRMMRQLLEDPQTLDLDSTVTVLAVASSAEARFHRNIAVSRQHLGAVLRLLNSRQGLRGLQRMSPPFGITAWQIFQNVGYPGILDSRTTLDRALNRCESRLKQMRMWNILIRTEVSSLETLYGRLRGGMIDETTEINPSNVHIRAAYCETRRQCLGTSTLLARCLLPGLTEVPEATGRCQVANLYNINSMLYHLRDDGVTAASFLMELAYTLRNSYSTAEGTAAGEEMSPGKAPTALPPMIGHCALRNGQWLDEEWRPTPPALRTWESLEFVELMMMLSPQRRRRMMTMMHSWLASDLEDSDLEGRPGELDEIRTEIVDRWNADHFKT